MLLVHAIDDLSKDLETKTAQEIIHWTVNEFWPEIAMSSSFQTQSIPLLHMVVNIKPSLPVFSSTQVPF